MKHLSDKSPIYNAEVFMAYLDLAQENISKKNQPNKSINFSDSKSILRELQNKNNENSLLLKLINKINVLSKNRDIILYWIASNISIQGNEKADKETKVPLNIRPTNIDIRYMDLCPTINKSLEDKWQQLWNNCQGTKLPNLRE